MDICGAIYPVDYELACDLFGGREDGYELLLVHQSHLAPMHLDYAIPDNVGYVWMCGRPTANPDGGLSDKRHPATADYPILQSCGCSRLDLELCPPGHLAHWLAHDF